MLMLPPPKRRPGESPEAFGRFLRAELPRWERAVKASGARLD